jgi:cell division protein FtsQ
MSSASDRFAERARSERRRRLRRRYLVLALAVLPPALAVAAYASPLLRVTGVDVHGAHRLTPARIVSAARVGSGSSLVTLDTDEVRRRVTSLRGVRSATVRRAWPHRVVIEVVERVPAVAVAQEGGGVHLYDREGVSLGVSAKAPKGAVVLRVTGSGPPAKLVPVGFQVVKSLPADLRARVRDASVRTRDDVLLTLADGATVAWGSAQDGAAKAAALRALLAHPARHYDVRAPGNVTLTPG